MLPKKLAAAPLTVPVKVGELENTTLPVPVSSVKIAASSAEVSKSVVDAYRGSRNAVSMVSTPELFKSPAPVKSVNASPLIINVVVVAMLVVKLFIVDDAVETNPPVKVNNPEAVSASSERKKLLEATPPTRCASKALGTVPSALRGIISPSLSMLTPSHSGWLKSTLVSEATSPSMTENNPFTTLT